MENKGVNDWWNKLTQLQKIVVYHSFGDRVDYGR